MPHSEPVDFARARQQAALRAMKWFWFGVVGAVGLALALFQPQGMFTSDAALVREVGLPAAVGLVRILMLATTLLGFGRFALWIGRALEFRRLQREAEAQRAAAA